MKSAKPQPKKPEENLSRAKRIQREIIAWMWVILFFLLINGTLGQARVIPSGSMENTLLIGDHLIMSRIGYDAGVPFTNWHVPLWRNPKRQQMVIFTPIVPQETSDIIKRVIGLPGETIDIRDGGVWINGQKLTENYTTGPSETYGMHTPYKIPENCYFVMGDNRGNSYDSRFTGCIPRPQPHHRHTRPDLHVAGCLARRLGNRAIPRALFSLRQRRDSSRLRTLEASLQNVLRPGDARGLCNTNFDWHA